MSLWSESSSFAIIVIMMFWTGSVNLTEQNLVCNTVCAEKSFPYERSYDSQQYMYLLFSFTNLVLLYVLVCVCVLDLLTLFVDLTMFSSEISLCLMNSP